MFHWTPKFTQGDPFDRINWSKRDAKIGSSDGRVVFEQKNVEVPEFWSQTATDIVASKYFSGKKNSPEREHSIKQLINRVAKTISGWGFKDGYFDSPESAKNFENDLKWLLVNQYASFNSPAWFNVGVIENPQCSACFILSVEDDMDSILHDWYATEGKIFKNGSGAGLNISKLRSSKESLSKGGTASGPVSFMQGADGVANSIKSGGRTRRAAKMIVLDADHPDIKDFIYCKKITEEMARTLAQTGKYDSSIEGKLFSIYTTLPFQNANNSVRVTDEFMEKVLNDGQWDLKARTNGETIEKIKAKEILDWCADAAWHSADPGIQYDTTINKWHTCPNSGRINASNPCSEYMHIDNSACNLASMNFLRFMKEDGRTFDIELFKKAIGTMILAQDILIDNSSYPTEKITKNAKDFRQLGLGFANLGALLMARGLPYDSDEGRAMAGAISAIMCGEAYRMSAEIARQKGTFNGYQTNREPMLDVIKMHRDEAYKINTNMIEQKELVEEAKNVWDKALLLGQESGYRNSQVTVIAPTGTIAFMMDCDTTGIEPALALISYKKLVGGGVLRLVNNQVTQALKKLGYNEQQIKDIADYIDTNETIEGAPHVKEEHLPVFDCSFKAAKGTRTIGYLGHLKMMGAVQPFVSGAISKTINLPKNAAKEEIFNAFIEAWRLGIKAVAFYRDGSKTVQPLNTEKEEKKIQLPKLIRRHLPNERPAIHHKFSIAGHEGYMNIGLYPEDYKVGETFINMAKEGSTISGLMDAIAILTSISLQYGIPLKVLVKKMKDMRFEPTGMTTNRDIPFANSIVDYVFKYLGAKFLTDEEKVEIFGNVSFGNGLSTQTNRETKTNGLNGPANGANGGVNHNGHSEKIDMAPKNGILNGNSNGLEAVMAKLTQIQEEEQKTAQPSLALSETTENPLCSRCGYIMYRAGTCLLCRNCGEVTGVCS